MCAFVTCEPWWLTEQFRIWREGVSFEAEALRPLLKATMPFGQELSSCLISPFLYSYKSSPRPFHCGSVRLVWLIQTAMLGKGIVKFGVVSSPSSIQNPQQNAINATGKLVIIEWKWIYRKYTHNIMTC